MRQLIVIALFCLTVPAMAQVLRFDRLTQDDGLSQNNVASLAQDSFGFLWIGTQDGLNRFDGYDLRRFRPDGTNAAPPSGYILSLAAGRDGAMWIGTREGGLSLWNPKSETFKTWIRRDPRIKESQDFDTVTSLLASDDGTVWVCTFEGLDHFDPRTNKFRRIISEKEIAFATRTDDGTIWFGVRHGPLSYLDRDNKPHQLDHPFGSIRAIAPAGAGRFWAGTEDGELLVWNPAARQFAKVSDFVNSDAVNSLRVDRRGVLWIATDGGGVFVRDPKRPELGAVRHDPADPNSIPSDLVTELFEDRTGVLWFGTNVGLARHDPASQAFRVYRHGPESLPDPYIWAATTDREGNIWVGTNSGAAILDVATGKWRSFQADVENPKALASNSISTILVDRSGTVWLGGNKGLSRYDKATDSFESWRRGQGEPLPGRVFSLLEARNGNLLIGTGNGFMQWNPATRSISRVGGDRLIGAAIFNLSEDRSGDVWVGTFLNGLYLLDLETNAIIRAFPFDPQQITSTAVDSQGRLWIGTTAGLYRRDSSSSSLRHYRIRDGLPNEMIMGIIEDRDRKIWVSTNDGIVRLDPTTHDMRTWKVQDGLPSNEFNQMAAGRTPAGEILFGTPNGLLRFDPRAIASDATPPQVALTGFEIFNDAVPIGEEGGDHFSLAQSIATTDKIVLSHREKVLTFTFAALHFNAPKATRYAYRLEGWDDAWRETPADRRSATYTNLPPGNYRLRVRAANKDGVWNQEGATVAVRVLPPWWRTWWAYSIYALSLLLAIAAFIRFRTRALRLRQRELELLVDVRTEELQKANAAKSVFLANMSHELRTPLNAVLGFSQLLERSPVIKGDDRKSLDIIHRAGSHLLGLINDVLSLSKIEAGRLTLDSRPFSLRAAVHSVETMMRVRAEKSGLRFICELDDSLPDAVTGDEGKLRQVLVNLVGNAVKFTTHGSVTMRASWREERAFFEVEDTGHGISEVEKQSLFESFVQTESGRKSKEGTGLGLAITREIIRLMKGDISVRSEVGKGSVFSFDVAMPSASDALIAEEHRRVVALAPGERPRRILVADDSADNRLLIVRLLGAVGLEVIEAANGEEAVERWEVEHPDLVLMDMRMPVLDGRDATRLIRQREEKSGARRTSILALTASAFEHERDDILSCGADDFLTKPFRESQLFAALEKHTGVRFQSQEDSAEPERSITREHIDRLSPEEVQRLREALEGGDVEKAAEVATTIRLRDDLLGRELLADIRAYRVDHLLDLLEQD